MTQTQTEYRAVLGECRTLFSKKLKDYGPAWRILRLPSLTDQLYIKANRIRSIQQAGQQKVEDSIEGEFIGILNYSIAALIQLDLGVVDQPDLSAEQALAHFDRQADRAFQLMELKNHDYGEAWRDMRIPSLADMILQKILRVKQIEDNQGLTVASEGVDANYLDMINYAAFALIKMKFQGA
jgi:hypothetical protein